jgi:hypothetical protein
MSIAPNPNTGISIGTYAKLDGTMLVRMTVNDFERSVVHDFKPHEAAELARALLGVVQNIPKVRR